MHDGGVVSSKDLWNLDVWLLDRDRGGSRDDEWYVETEATSSVRECVAEKSEGVTTGYERWPSSPRL